MEDDDASSRSVPVRPYSGEWNSAWQDSRPAGAKAFRPTPPTQRRNVERVLFASAQTEATAESMLDDAWRQQAVVQDRGSAPPAAKASGSERFRGMSLKKFGYGVSEKRAAEFAEQVGGSASASMPQRRKEQKDGRSLDLQDLAFSRPRKIVDGQIKSNYTPVSLPYFRVADTEAEANNSSARPTIQNVDETNANAAKQLFFNEDGSLLEDQLLLMQLPSVLPEMLDPFEEVQREHEAEDKSATSDGGTLTRLPDGHWGKLRIHKSGKVRMELGGVEFCVDEGCTTFFQQDLACVCPLASEIFHLGKVQRRVVLTPDIDALLDGLSEEPMADAAPSAASASNASGAIAPVASRAPVPAFAPAQRAHASGRGRIHSGGGSPASSARSHGEREQAMPSAGLPTSLGPRSSRA